MLLVQPLLIELEQEPGLIGRARKDKMEIYFYKGKKYKFKSMEDANNALPLGDGMWDERKPGEYICANNGTYKIGRTHWAWVVGNFYD